MVWPSRSRGEVRQLLPPMSAFHHEREHPAMMYEILRSSQATFSSSDLLDHSTAKIDADFASVANGIRARVIIDRLNRPKHKSAKPDHFIGGPASIKCPRPRGHPVQPYTHHDRGHR